MRLVLRLILRHFTEWSDLDLTIVIAFLSTRQPAKSLKTSDLSEFFSPLPLGELFPAGVRRWAGTAPCCSPGPG